jgi:hypothetical protein
MTTKEELIKLLMESYDRGVNDAKQEALIALEKVVAVAVSKEREACAELVFNSPPSDEYESPLRAVYNAIRARGNT